MHTKLAPVVRRSGEIVGVACVVGVACGWSQHCHFSSTARFEFTGQDIQILCVARTSDFNCLMYVV